MNFWSQLASFFFLFNWIYRKLFHEVEPPDGSCSLECRATFIFCDNSIVQERDKIPSIKRTPAIHLPRRRRRRRALPTMG